MVSREKNYGGKEERIVDFGISKSECRFTMFTRPFP